MVYLRPYLTVGVFCHGLSEAVSDRRSALSWSRVTTSHHLSDELFC